MTDGLAALAVGDHGAVVVRGDGAVHVDAAGVAAIEREWAPRWVTWDTGPIETLVHGGVRLRRAWNVAAVHRLLYGGWRADPARVWAQLGGRSVADVPVVAPVDLFHPAADPPDTPVRPDGHLDPSWADGWWRGSPAATEAWARLALAAAERQRTLLLDIGDGRRAVGTAHQESTTELLCAELGADGLPVDRAVLQELIADAAGPRPVDDADADRIRAARDAAVLRLAPGAEHLDLRSPGQVRSLLRRVGIEVPDTRAWRLRELRHAHPLVEALLRWRKDERIATTYGYSWLDQYVGTDDRLRGTWTGCDGSAGRMTASAGLHNLPAELRPAVVAASGHVFVRADLGQIEPRVLAAVSGDPALSAATMSDDLYEPVAVQMGVDRATAKVAVLGAMYGQTTGHGAEALWRLRAAYPTAMSYLDAADAAGQGARDLRTFGGRLIAMSAANANEVGERELRSHAAARGRYGRNAMVQGAAAELFKAWALTVRAAAGEFGASIVLCLHDELLVHTPADRAADVAAMVDECLDAASRRWVAGAPVRFVADTSVVRCWADAK